MNFLLDDASSEGMGNGPKKTATLFLYVFIIMLFCVISMSMVDNITRRTAHDHFIRGIRYGTKAYSSQYQMTDEGLAQISEGYLLQEDIIKYGLKTNPVEVDSTKASKIFYTLLYGNTMISDSELRSYKIYMFNIYTVYSKVSGNNDLTVTYIVRGYNSSGSLVYSSSSNTLLGIQQYVESSLGVKTDLENAVNKSIHREQAYQKEGTTGDKQKTYSTFNTYMCIGKDVPLHGRFSTELINFCELQTYSTSR